MEEAEKARSKHSISQDAVLEWIFLNKVLSVALEGNIDQVQYTDRVKASVEFSWSQIILRRANKYLES